MPIRQKSKPAIDAGSRGFSGCSVGYGKGYFKGGGGDAPTFAVADGGAIPSPVFVFHFSFFTSMRYFLWLSYLGTAYCGWQRQPNGMSVQQCVEEALATILRRPIPLTAAGRTDAGVHARQMATHFDTDTPLPDPPSLVGRLNGLLPPSIAALRIHAVRPDAHARFSATARTYIYAVTDVKDPFMPGGVHRMSLRGIDFEAMNRAAAVLPEYADFTSFSKLHTDVKTNICRITRADWRREGACWIFTITADRFLRNMVRAIVGTLLEVGRGRRSVDDFRRVIEARDRCRAGDSAAADGLTLLHVAYPPEIHLD